MSTPYEKLYANLLPKFRSYEIPLMTELEVKQNLHDYIIPAASKFTICKKNLDDRDDSLEVFNETLSNDEIEIISNFMIIEYIDSTYIRTPTLLKVNLSSSDFNSYSPANMLDKLNAMQTRYRKENETLLSRYSWISKDGKSNAFKNLKKNSIRKQSLD